MDRITLLAERGERGWWYVSSPDAPGMIVTGPNLTQALMCVEAALDELRAAEVSRHD